MDALYYLSGLAVMAVLAVVVRKWHGKSAGAGPEGLEGRHVACGTCSAGAGKCIGDCIVENSVGEIEYFDDEELDGFRGRRSDSYTADEAAMFAEVMYTMKPVEVKDWLKSLRLRCVELPDQLKDEAMMLAEG